MTDVEDLLVTWKPDCEMPKKHRNFQGPAYGLDNLGDLFTDRQLAALTTFSDLVGEARERIREDAGDDYAAAVALYLACAVSRQADYGSQCHWVPVAEGLRHLFGRQALPMVWNYAEGNPLGGASGGYCLGADQISHALQRLLPATRERMREDAGDDYAAAVALYLAMGASRGAEMWSMIASWNRGPSSLRGTFARQAIPMMWDYAEGGPLGRCSRGWDGLMRTIQAVPEVLPP